MINQKFAIDNLSIVNYTQNKTSEIGVKGYSHYLRSKYNHNISHRSSNQYKKSKKQIYLIDLLHNHC